jgi:hypothetical protein
MSKSWQVLLPSAALLLFLGVPAASQPGQGAPPDDEQGGRFRCIYVTPVVGGAIEAFLLDSDTGAVYFTRTRPGDEGVAVPEMKSKPILPEGKKAATRERGAN